MFEANAAGYANRLVQVRDAGTPEDILAILRALAELPITVATLKETNIGRIVNHASLRQHDDGEIRDTAAALVQRWVQAALESRGAADAGAAAGAAPAAQPRAEAVTPPPKGHAAKAPGSSEKQPQQDGEAPAGRAAKAAGDSEKQPQQLGEAKPSPAPREISAREYLAQFRAKLKTGAAGKATTGRAAAGQPQKSHRTAQEQSATHAERQKKPPGTPPPPPSRPPQAQAGPPTRKRVVQAFDYMEEKAKVAKLVAPTFGPQPANKPKRGRNTGFCYTYYKGDCAAGGSCSFAHVKSA